MNNPTLLISQTPPWSTWRISGSVSGHVRSSGLATSASTTICHLYWVSVSVLLCLGVLVASTGFIQEQ